MNGETYCLTRISPLREQFSYHDWVQLGGLDPYGQHQLLWRFFDLPNTQEPRKQAPFLFRADSKDGLPLLYVLSRARPRDTTGKWCTDSKEFHPVLEQGDRLAFKLRVNPVVERPGSEVIGNNGKPKLRQSGIHAGKVKRKVLRHDVVMDVKLRMGWKDMPADERPSLAQVAYEGGSRWLRDREDRLGCRVEFDRLHVDGHTVYHLKWRGISLSTLDFTGELQVADTKKFLSALYHGIGPAKAFGCGLLLVRRL